MVRVIAQETYDEVVRENLEEFSMTPEEAIEDAINQFHAQGVDLTNIIKDLAMTSSADSHAISASVRKLENYLKLKSTCISGIITELESVKKECDKDIPHRVLAGKEGIYTVLLNLILSYESEKDLTKQCLRTMIALMTGQPDLLTPEGVDLIIKFIDNQEDTEILSLILRWTKECCIKHEHNRQNIFDAGIVDHLKTLLKHADVHLLRDVCAVLRGLVLDDDVRVEFGKAHEHARVIASDTLCAITDLLNKFKHDEALVNDILLTLSSLIVRNEFCTKVDDAGGLDFLLDALKDFSKNEQINRQAMKLLKVLAGNDDCKAHIIQKGGAKAIVVSLTQHKESSKTVTFGLNTIAALTLRSPENSKVLFNAGIPEIIVECMSHHPDDMMLQKSASWAIRNMVSRSRYQNEKFLELGIEEILQEDLKKFRNDCEYDIKAALRDLGCNVEFKEEWTGKGGKIHTEEKE